MGRRLDRVFVHLVWSTWDRLPVLDPSALARVLGVIRDECAALGAEVVACNGVADHVHLLVRLPTTVTIATIAKQAKGVSSHLMNHEVRPGELFRWQGHYGVFSVSPGQVAAVAGYIANQPEHHPLHDP